MLRKNTDVAEGFVDAVLVPRFGEKLLQALGRNMGKLLCGVFANPGRTDGLGTEVGSKNLKMDVVVLLVLQFKQDHGNRIHFFAGGAGCHPNA